MRLEVAAVLILLLAPAALGQGVDAPAYWNQRGGDAGQTRIVDLPNAPLDVIATGRLTEGVEVFPNIADFVVQTEDGLLALVGPRQSDLGAVPCAIVRVVWESTLSFAPERILEEDCPDGARLIGTVPSAGLAIACWDGPPEAVELRALDADSGTLVWAAGLPANPSWLGGALDQNDWSCSGVIEGDRIVTVFSNALQHVVVAYDFAGTTLWSATVGASELVSDLGSNLSVVQDRDPSSAAAFDRITQMDGGYLLWGLATEAYLAWLDDEGALVSIYSTADRPRPVTAGFDVNGAVPPVAQGDSVAAVLPRSADLAVVRATDASPALVPLPDAVSPSGDAAIWWRDHFVVPEGPRGISALRMPDLTDRWRWKHPATQLDAMVVTEEGELLVLSRDFDDAGWLPVLSTVDLTTRVETSRLDIPHLAFTEGNAVGVPDDAQLIGLHGQGILVALRAGQVALLGVADAARVPSAALSDAFPAPGSPTEITATRPVGVTRMHVAWGDGTFEDVDEAARHSYAAEGVYEVRLTAYYADNHTATRALSVDVGGTPPVHLTAVQRAFSPENQELTFFVLGLAFTAGGVLFAALLRRRRQSHLARESRRLHELQDLAARDPVAGLTALEAHRRHLEDAHVRRKLDDAHYAHLDARTIRAMRATRLQLLGATVNELSPHFRGLLDTALDDGRISPGEMRALDAALANERVAPPERDRIRALLAGWAR